MIKNIASKWNVFLIVLFVILLGCSNVQIEKIEFVKKGMTQELETHGAVSEAAGYLEAEGEFYLKAKRVIYGNEIILNVRLRVNDYRGWIPITFGDNNLILINESDEEAIILQGPSIGKGINLGKVSDFIKPDVPFDLFITYKTGKLFCSINEQEIYSNETYLPPAGLLSIGGEIKGNLRIYDMVCESQLKSIEDFYTKEVLLDRAHNILARVSEIVKDDPNRPAFHFQPPANWNNDPNGMLFYKDYYHMFYQHNPYADHWDWMHWGHARSKDLVHWEHLPIALWPSVEKGENHCFSGSGYIKDDGKPILFYTSIGHEFPEHWAGEAVDDELFDWEKHPANPIIVMEDHGDQFIEDWRDPFLFREKGETYMVIGGHPPNGKGSIMMYKSLNPDLTKWEYLGIPFSGVEENWECPNFFRVGDKYVLIYSPHEHVKYYTGTLDVENVKFKPVYHGTIDNGWFYNYYAPNTLQKDDGRRILFGWISGFKSGQGWKGAISLPRDLSINQEGRLIQKPVQELTELRGEVTTLSNISLNNSSKNLEINFPQFEMKIKVSNGANQIGFRFNNEDGKPYDISITPKELTFGEDEVEVDPILDETIKSVHLFFDRTIIEIFVNDGLLCATKVVYPELQNLNFGIFSEEQVIIELIDIWNMSSIWKKGKSNYLSTYLN
jgi:beta-fructofuranosidase